jgi:ATP-dependent phosphofructokinase / diphosphate-dependent phosphofructokinase
MAVRKTKKRIGILTSGGDCPGLNAAIRGVGKTAILEYGMEVFGIGSGFEGLIHKDVEVLDEHRLSGIITLGGTILGTSREKPFKKGVETGLNKIDLIKKNIKALGLDCVVCIGGNGTQKTAFKLAKEGLNIIGVPKTIDNDVWGTDQTFGFDSAVAIATEAIDRLHTTANAHKRIMVLEVMGHKAGWLALHSGIAGGGDVILIPEIPFTVENIAGAIKRRISKKKPYSIVVVAEGAGNEFLTEGQSPGYYVSSRITELTGVETRNTVLGYLQRGGAPSAFDRILATNYGACAAELIARGEYGKMVALRCNEIKGIPLSEVAGKLKTVQTTDSLVQKARILGTSFGDKS